MAKYTIDLYSLLKDKNFNLFDFEYNFYTQDLKLKQEFEEKFIDNFLFNEIGFETVIRFKHFLKQRLNLKAPYYKQLYETELKSKNIQFLLNKDLTETFEREVTSEGTNDNTISSSDKIKQGNKESYLENGNADLGLTEGNLTGVSENTTDNTSSANTSNTTNNKQSEKTTLTSQGNIGVTSSAELLRDWRSVLININEIIINDCSDLFMSIY